MKRIVSVSLIVLAAGAALAVLGRPEEAPSARGRVVAAVRARASVPASLAPAAAPAGLEPEEAPVAVAAPVVAPAATAERALEVTVVDDAGRPVRGARVIGSDREHSVEGTTSDAGVALLSGLEGDELLVSAEADGATGSSETAGGRVTVRLGVRAGLGALSVSLRDERGAALVERATLVVTALDGEHEPRLLPIEHASSATVRDLPSGRWSLALDVAEPEDLSGARATVTVRAGEVVDVALRLEKLGLLRGVVRGAGGPVEVALAAEDGDETFLACDPDGRFTLRGRGLVRVRASADGMAPTWRAVELRPDVTVDATFDLVPGVPVTVVATFEDGRPAAGESVLAWRSARHEELVDARLDEEGKATLRFGGEGPYEVSVLSALVRSAGDEVRLVIPERGE